jgi:hypothetical protein
MQDSNVQTTASLASDQPTGRLSPRGIVAKAIFGFAALAVFCFVLLAAFQPNLNLTGVFLVKQDRWLLLAAFFALALCSQRLRDQAAPLRFSEAAPWLVAAGVLVLCYFGHLWVLDGYDLSRDEQMATFDSQILSAGRLAQPLPPFWQAHPRPLNTVFMMPVAQPIAWVSAYLPGNAALRALIGFVADPALTGPLMAALGAVALWNCARLLWPGEREAAAVALLLYIASGQILAASMTSYAMPAHLAVNLLWLWLFLINRRLADLGALAVAALATGLHQPLFHPLFAAPFLFMLLRDGASARLALYGLGYGLICAFWLYWPHITLNQIMGPQSQIGAAGADYLTRLSTTLFHGDPLRWPNMAANLLRFVAWQPILLGPLMLVALRRGRSEPMTLALAACVALPVLAMALLLPYQGHGFGYRYLHGVIGPAILLAVQGWRKLAPETPALRPLLVRLTAIGLLMILPLQLWFAHALYAPFVRIDAQIAASSADYAMIGLTDAPFASDLVINRPDLSNRPLRLIGDFVDDEMIATLCRPGARVALPGDGLFDGVNSYFNAAPDAPTGLASRLRAAGCVVERIDAKG